MLCRCALPVGFRLSAGIEKEMSIAESPRSGATSSPSLVLRGISPQRGATPSGSANICHTAPAQRLELTKQKGLYS